MKRLVRTHATWTLASLVLLAGCTRGGAPSGAPAAPAAPAPAPAAPAPAAPVADTAPVPSPAVSVEEPAPILDEERTPLGAPPRTVSESVELDRSSPASVLAALHAAIERDDATAIARLRSQSAHKPALDEQDLLRARLDFLGERARHWRRVLAAAGSGVATIDPSGDTATLRVDLGGALGAFDIHFTKEASTWAVAH